MSSDNAKLRLIEGQNAGEVLREMGYEPEHVEGTPSEQAKAMLEEARADLDEALDRIEEDTYAHEIVGSAYDELEFVINQTWPTENSEPWQDGTHPMTHAGNCLMYCLDIVNNGDHSAPSIGIVCGAMAQLEKAAILLWGDKFTADIENRHKDRAKAEAAAMIYAAELEADALETADEYARKVYVMPEHMRDCWGTSMPDIDEPTGAALHLIGAVATLDHIRLATEGTATSGSIEGAMDHIASAVDILWPEVEQDGTDERMAADDTDEATDEEIVEAILDVIAKVDMDEAKSRAKADAPTTLEEAMNLLNEAADMANWLHTATDFMADDTEDARETASIAKERAMDVMTNTMAAYYYLNGGTFADRDPEQGEADGGMLEYIYKQLENINGMLDSAIKDGHVKSEPDEDGAYPWQHEVKSNLLCLMFDVHEAINGSTATAGNATTDGESLDGIPYIEVGYADGSSVRTTGHFSPHTVADVARLITLTTAPTEEEEE